MSKTVQLELPDDLRGWREAIEVAKNVYWISRRDGKTENEAILAVLDELVRDRFNSPPS